MIKSETNKIKFRVGTVRDGSNCGKICFDAFQSIAAKHNFPSEFPSLNTTVDIISSMLINPGFYSVIAEIEGAIVGSNFLDERGPIVGIGPISIGKTYPNCIIRCKLFSEKPLP